MTAPKSAPRKGKPTYIAGATAAQNRASSKPKAAKAVTRPSNTGSVSASLPKKKSNVITGVSHGTSGGSGGSYISSYQATSTPPAGATPPAGVPSSSGSSGGMDFSEMIRNLPSSTQNGMTGVDSFRKMFGF